MGDWCRNVWFIVGRVIYKYIGVGCGRKWVEYKFVSLLVGRIYYGIWGRICIDVF